MVGVALVPTAGSLSVLRALRIVRVLRLISTVPAMRRVVGALFSAIPGMGTIAALLGLLFYVFAVMATNLFGAAFPDWFGTLGRSAYSLFQVMTLESWSMGIVRPVMVTYPLAWAFFLPFILVTSFAVLNLFIGIIVDAMQTHHRDTEPVPANRPPAPATGSEDDRAVQLAELRALRAQVATLDARLAERRPGPEAQRAGRPGPAHGRACQTVHT